jgi:PadR family transcriptional regulator PadR
MEASGGRALRNVALQLCFSLSATYPYVACYVITGQVANYIGTIPAMEVEAKLSHTAAMILHAIHAGNAYGFSVMEVTGLPSGTVYPAMRRLERDGLIISRWEQQSIADQQQRPVRKYYKVTRTGKVSLESLYKRYPLLSRMIPLPEVNRA